MLALLTVLVIVGKVTSSKNHINDELVDTIAFPDTVCDGARCRMELSAAGEQYTLHMDDTVDIAPPIMNVEDVYSDRTVSRQVDNPQSCVHYGKVVKNGKTIGSMMLNLCETKTASLYTTEGEYSVIPIHKDDAHNIRRRRSTHTHVVYSRRSTDTHVVYSLEEKVRLKRVAIFQPVVINDLLANSRSGVTPLPSYKRLSPDRTLRMELALFIDKEYQESYFNSPIGSKDPAKLRKHIMDVMRQVQMWYLHPSMGYKIKLYITKIIFMQQTTQEINDFSDLASFCKNYQASFLPGGSRAGNSKVTWDDAILFSGVTGIFGERSPGNYIYGRAIRWGACDPNNQCMGINDHFETSPKLLIVENYLGRLVTHELSHTLGMADEYSDFKYKDMCTSGLMYSQYTGRDWSNCSIYELEHFLLSEFSTCLDTAPDTSNRDMVTVQPAPPLYSTVGAIDGGWGRWSSYGPCSLPCDGGVQLSTRKCDNPTPRLFGRVCTGLRYRVQLCNIEACPASSLNNSIWDLYSEECQKVGRSFDFRRDTPGIFNLTGTQACAQKCRSKGTTRWYDYPVSDGFRCRDGQDDMCIDGICMEIGCDKKGFYSSKRRDECGVCNGNGRTCRIVSGRYVGQEKDLQIVKRIPSGSRDIFIKLDVKVASDARGNYIDLGEEDIPTNPYSTRPTQWTRLREGREGTYKVWWAGVMWEYFDEQSLPHILRTRYRIEEDIIVWLRRTRGARTNPGVMWSYTTDNVTTEESGEDSDSGSKEKESSDEDSGSNEKEDESGSKESREDKSGRDSDESGCDESREDSGRRRGRKG